MPFYSLPFFLAEQANIDPDEALIYLVADRARDFKAQQIWNDITAKLISLGGGA